RAIVKTKAGAGTVRRASSRKFQPAPYAPPMNGERPYEDFILASLVQFASRRQADRPGFARPTAAAVPRSGGAGGSRHAVADAAAGPGHQHEHPVLEPVGAGGDWLDRLLHRG